MLAKPSKWLLVLALVFSIGAHWALLQSVAWTTMLAANLSTDSWSEAVSKTFDSEHPCELCKKIKAGKDSEQKPERQIELKKLEFVCISSNFSCTAPGPFALPSGVTRNYSDCDYPPPVPPPRSYLV